MNVIVIYVGLCGRMAVSLICWALWPCDRQSDVGLCGRAAVSLICWALWLYSRQSDMLGFVAVWPSV